MTSLRRVVVSNHRFGRTPLYTQEACLLVCPPRLALINLKSDYSIFQAPPRMPAGSPSLSRPDDTEARQGSSLVEDLFEGLPPAWLAGFRAHGAGDQALLHLVRHLPPLAHLGVRGHLLHVPLVVVSNVGEAGEQDAVRVVVMNAICGPC